MRLIDADALKNDLITFFPDKCLEGITTKTLFKQILTDIDNAPTVEPERPQGDLISREALKEQFTKAGKDYNHECVIEMLSALATIDNAPTVEIPIARWDAYCEGQKVGYEKGIEDRPHGEWIENVFLGGFVCSNCNGGYNTLPKTKYCPLCGADMRGGEES